MTGMQPPKKHERLLALTPAIVLWGCFGGLCLAAMNFLLQGIWAPILAVNYAYSPVFQVQTMGSSGLLLWILGMKCADIFRTDRSTWLDPAITGFFSGICTALVFTSVFVYSEMIIHPPILYYANDPFHIRVFFERLFQQWLILFAGLILVSAILQALGSWYQWSRSNKPATPKKHVFVEKLPCYRLLISAMLVLLIIPPGLVYLGVAAGFVEKQPCCTIMDTINVQRTGPDSIQIDLKTNPGFPRIIPGITPFVNISVDGKDVSTQSLATGSGLKDTLTPPEGLLYHDNATVSLRGKDISGNRTAPIHLMIIVTYRDPDNRAIIGDMDI
jgi:hypothetical protein